MSEDSLRGGTEGGRVPPFAPNDRGGIGGNSNAANPAGTSHDTRSVGGDVRGRGTRTGAREDAEELFENTRHQSPDTAKQFARDAADVDTEAGSPNGAGPPRHHQIHPTETAP